MLFGYQSNDQQNIVSNNVNSSISNSVTNSNTAAIDIDTSQSAENIVHFGGNVHLGPGCTLDMNNKLDLSTKANLVSISKTDTQFDNNIGIDISNDLNNQAKQETPGIGGGFLSSQVSNQLNSVSNQISNKISNDVYISRTNSINNYSKQRAGNNIAVDEDFFCENANIKLTNDLASDTIMELFTDSYDKTKITNSIQVALSNTLSNKMEQSGSAFMAIIIVVILILFLAPGIILSTAMKPVAKYVIPPGIFTLFFSIIWASFVMSDYFPFMNDNEKYEWISDYDGFFSGILDKIIDNEPDCPGDSKLNLDDIEGIEKQDCIDFYLDLKNWKHDWKEKSIRKKVNIVDDYGDKLDYNTLKRDINSDAVCKDDFSSSSEHCRTVNEDFRYENYLKSAFSCVDNDVEITNDMFSYYHDLYSTDGPLAGNPKYQIRNYSPIQDFDKTLEILQPGTGYLTGGPYITKCTNKGGPCCKDRKEGCRDLIVNVRSTDSCSSSDVARTQTYGEVDGERQRYTTSSQYMEDASLGWGEGCFLAADKSGEKTWQGFQNLSSYLFGGMEWNSTGTPIGPQVCDYSNEGSGKQLLGWLEAGMGICPDLGDFAGSNKETCVRGDRCFVNYKKWQQTQDNTTKADKDIIINKENVLSNCPYAYDANNVAAPAKKDTKCIFEVGGVNQIKILNAKEAKDNDHVIHPDNVYTIKSKLDEGDTCGDGDGDSSIECKQALYIDSPFSDSDGFDVVYNEDKMNKSSLKNNNNGIWAASNLMITTNARSFDPTFRRNSDGENYKICKANSPVTENRKWDGMENICETKFKFLPLLKTSSGRELGCSDEENSQNMKLLAACQCVKKNDAGEFLERSEFSPGITRVYTNTFYLYLYIPIAICFIVSTIIFILLIKESDTDTDGENFLTRVQNRSKELYENGVDKSKELYESGVNKSKELYRRGSERTQSFFGSENSNPSESN